MNIKPVTVAIALFLLPGCAGPRGVGDASFLETSRKATWGKAGEWRAVEPGAPTPLLGEWVVTGGQFVAVGGEGNRAIILAPMPGEAVRVSFDVNLQSDHPRGWIGDISVALGATDDPKTFFHSGYALTSGSYWNRCSTIYRLRQAIVHTEWSPPRPNVWHRVVVEKVGGRLRYQLDGQVVLQAFDAAPLEPDGECYVVLRTWETRMAVRNVVIETP